MKCNVRSVEKPVLHIYIYIYDLLVSCFIKLESFVCGIPDIEDSNSPLLLIVANLWYLKMCKVSEKSTIVSYWKDVNTSVPVMDCGI